MKLSTKQAFPDFHRTEILVICYNTACKLVSCFLYCFIKRVLISEFMNENVFVVNCGNVETDFFHACCLVR